MKYLLSFNEASMIPKDYVNKYGEKMPGESDVAYIKRMRAEKESEKKTIGKIITTNKPTNEFEEKVLNLLPEIKTGEKQFDKEIETIGKSYIQNQQRIDTLMDDFMKELNISKSQIYNTDNTPKDPELILDIFNEKAKEVKDPNRLQELSKRLMDLMVNKNESVLGWTVGIIGTLTAIAWLRGMSRHSLNQTAGPRPNKWYEKAYQWLRQNGIDLSFGLDPNRENPLIVSDRPYGRTYGEWSNDPNDKVRTVLDPSYGPEKGGKPLQTGSGTQYGYRTGV